MIKKYSSIVFNGWQRLWVFFSLLLVVLTSAIIVSHWPKESDLTEARAVYAVKLGLQAVVFKAKAAGNERDELEALRALEKGATEVRANSYRDLSATELLMKVRPVLQGTPYADELTNRESLDKSKVLEQQKELVLSGLLIWLGIISLTYAFGWGVFWVRSGFKNPP